MENYTRYYGRYAEQDFRMANTEFPHCLACGRETLRFIVLNETREVIGCPQCLTTRIPNDERYMVDVKDEVYLQCPICGELCDTLYADHRTKVVEGCDQCFDVIEAYKEE